VKNCLNNTINDYVCLNLYHGLWRTAGCDLRLLSQHASKPVCLALTCDK